MKFLRVLAVVVALQFCALAQNATPNLALARPAQDGAVTWSSALNNNFLLLDQFLSGTKALPSPLLATPVINGATSSGSTAIDFSGNSGAFKTTTGAVTIGPGATSVTGLPTFTAGVLASGSTANDFSASTGAFKTSTGTNTMGGRTVFPAGVAGASSFNIPTGVAPTTSAVGDFWVPAQVVPSFSEVSGSAISIVGNVFSLAGAQAATGINATTTITGSSFTMQAGLMNVAGKTLEGEAWGTYVNVTGTPTVALAVKIGAVTVATCTSAAVTNGVTVPVHFTFTVKTAAVGASGTDEAHCALDIPLAAAANAVGRFLDNNQAVSSTYDHTAANAIVIQGTSAGASNTFTLRDARYDLKN